MRSYSTLQNTRVGRGAIVALATAALTIDREADVYFDGLTGVIVRGSVECSRTIVQARLGVTVHQKGPHGTVVRGYHEVPVPCAAPLQPWAILVAPSLGVDSFRYGKARVAVTLLGTSGEVEPAMASRSVRLVPGIF